MHTCIHTYVHTKYERKFTSTYSYIGLYKTYAPKTKKHYVNVRCALVENDIHVKKK